MASIRAIFILTTENKIIFTRRFQTIENRLKKSMGEDYIPVPSDKLFANIFFNKVIKEELLQDEFKTKKYKEDLEIDHQKMDELIKVVDIKEDFNYSECPIVSLDVLGKILWPCVYIKKLNLFGIIFPNIDYDKFKKILKERNGDLISKKLYEEQDLSIIGSFTLIENILDYIISIKSYDENRLHTLISNMIPFGNILETNINYSLESLHFLNQRFVGNTNITDKKKIPGWVSKINSNSNEYLAITIKEELKFVKYAKEKNFNSILCDISCLAELSNICEITIPFKEQQTNYLDNIRIHPCAKIVDQNILNEATRISFYPPHDEFKLGVFEIENIGQDYLPIRGDFSLKESAQNEVKLYLNISIDEKKAIGKFEYFYINIPLGHFGTIVNTMIMVQVGEVSLINNKTTLHWDLQNQVCDGNIVLSGTVNYSTNNTAGNVKFITTRMWHKTMMRAKALTQKNSNTRINVKQIYLILRSCLRIVIAKFILN
jgi:hypothetical protein